MNTAGPSSPSAQRSVGRWPCGRIRPGFLNDTVDPIGTTEDAIRCCAVEIPPPLDRPIILPRWLIEHYAHPLSFCKCCCPDKAHSAQSSVVQFHLLAHRPWVGTAAHSARVSGEISGTLLELELLLLIIGVRSRRAYCNYMRVVSCKWSLCYTCMSM